MPREWQRLIYQPRLPAMPTAGKRPIRWQKMPVRHQTRIAARRRAPPDPARGFQATWF